MKKFTFAALLFALGLLLGMIQLNPSPTLALSGPVVSQQDPSQTDNTAKKEKAQTFMGQIGQSADGKFVLQDDSTKAAYQLDDQDKAKQFAGQKVKVTGTLDSATNTIHVSKIEVAA